MYKATMHSFTFRQEYGCESWPLSLRKQQRFGVFNPSAWSDEHWSSCCTLSLIRLYLDNIWSKCNWAALFLFMKEMALLWCGRQLLEIISSFFLCYRILGFLFAVPNFTDGFMCLYNNQMKHETNVIAILT